MQHGGLFEELIMKTEKKCGGVLVMVMLITLVVSALTAGLYNLYTTDAVEAVYVDNSGQAFWLAESGLQRTLDKLRTDKSFRDNPTTLSDSYTNGTCNVTVWYSGSNVWNIVSSGTVANVSRVVKMDPYLYAEIGYGLMGLAGDSRLNKDGSIDGNVYSYGTLTVNGRSTPSISGEVNALDTRNLDFNPLTGNDRVEMEIDPPISDFVSVADTTPVPYINIVETNSLGIAATNIYVDLTGGKVVKVTGDYDFNNSYAEGTYGDGALIVDGDLTFKNSGDPFVIGDSGTVYVDGDIWAGKDGTFGQDVLIYATGSMSLQKAAGAGSTTLLVEGDLTVNKELDYNGLIFCDGSVTVDGDMTLNGSLIAGEDFWLKEGYDITYDGDEIPQDILDNMIVYVTYATTPGTWDEVAAF